MKSFIVLTALVAVALAAPQELASATARSPPQKHEAVTVVKEHPSNNDGLGAYHYSFQQSDGQTREETGQIVEIEKDQHAMRVKGSYSWVDPHDKQTYTVHYESDEYGYRPTGEHLPK